MDSINRPYSISNPFWNAVLFYRATKVHSTRLQNTIPEKTLIEFNKRWTQLTGLTPSQTHFGMRSYSTEQQKSNDNQSQHNNAQSDQDFVQNPSIGYWLAFMAAAVLGIIILGGLTRLTESGLSITEWKPFRGALPPISEEDWLAEFEKYKQSPEYEKINRGMTLDQFKFIYFMEWAHRQWGRALGVFFGVPLIYFALKGSLRGKSLLKALGLMALGGSQGALGWYMVKSGLDHKNFEDDSVPRVSQYRLAAHLSMAVTLYSLLFWMSMNQLTKRIPAISQKPPMVLKRLAIGTTALTGITLFSGALVAGLDAGLIYNEFPLMGGHWIPHGILAKVPLWRNFFENDTTVQFDHRVLGISTYTLSALLWGLSMYHRQRIPRPLLLASHGVFAAANLQVALGITTLLTFVPVPLAAAHQANALVLWTTLLTYLHRYKRIAVK
eukprot:TRINITY_DN2996_c0_g1_i2.p1 TRINITY_DN2996_c0_g1~~TRINITY_DN2996_c0_g1_i2.p1  ORF type:complete len:440 (-),score=55.00 TRINITY_DN2996_c0_g1_i2:271-1590(-)